MRAYIYRITIFLTICSFLLSGTCFGQEPFRAAIIKSLKVNKEQNRFRYLHFIFNFFPEFYEDTLTDLRYEIIYNEVGTNYKKYWVHSNDGHLINLNGLGVDSQWKGPFSGLRSVRYKFKFELRDDIENNTQKALYISIFSTHPEIDANYFESFYKNPFNIHAFYYDYTGLIKSLQTYKHISTVYAAYRVTRVANPLTVVATLALENIVILALESYLSNLEGIPINIHIKCNACGREYDIKRETFNDFDFQCSTPGCHNRATICFSD